VQRRALPIGLAVPAVAAAVALSGCGGGSMADTATAAKPAATPAAKPATVGTRHTALGTALVDAEGRTLYLFEKDKGAASSCYGACAAAWPPLAATATPKAAGDVKAGKLGISKRTDGTSIVTYAGHPLYTYAGDTAPGDTSGQGLDDYGAEWYAVAPGGGKIDKD
jgi:predicted lipoprotein with Yx(FWY)xxD motif